MDSDLLDRFHLGDASAFDELVERYQAAVYRFAFRMTQDRAAAEDVTQEVFVSAYRALGTFRRASSLKTWLFRITIRVACEERRRGRAPGGAAASTASVAADASASLERRELEAELARAIAALPARQRATLLLRVSQELPFKEIAEVMGSSLGTVKATYHQAVARLRTLLARPDSSLSRD